MLPPTSRLDRLLDPVHVVGNACVDPRPALESAAVAEGDHALLVPGLVVRPPHQGSAGVAVAAVAVEFPSDAQLRADQADLPRGELPRAVVVIVNRQIQPLFDGALAGCKRGDLIS